MILNDDELRVTLSEFLRQKEIEYVEFKEANQNFNFDDLGKYFSALSNEANLRNRQYGWLIFGVEDKKHILVNTRYRMDRASLHNLKKEIADKTNDRITFIEIYEVFIEGNRVIMFQIPAASGVATTWNGFAYGRDNESIEPLNDLMKMQIEASGRLDWSRKICYDATIDDLDSKAIKLAREKFKQKNEGKDLEKEIDVMSDTAFLNKAKLTIEGKITNAALLLLGKSESDRFFNDFSPQMTWKLQGENQEIEDYEHFSIPFILAVEALNKKIRNLRYRYIVRQMSLFPNEVDQYDPYIIRELLHNCIAHQNYYLKGRINVIECKDKLIFVNEGQFIPGKLENIFADGYVPPFYRNEFLARAMVNLNMIDTVGSGVKRVFNIQRKKFFPMPDYDLNENNRVKVTVYGKIIDENYTKMLSLGTYLDFETIILLDRVQKKLPITMDETKILRNKSLIEGRYPKIFVSSSVADITGDKVKYIHNVGMDDQYYKDLILKMIKQYSSVSRKDIEDLT